MLKRPNVFSPEVTITSVLDNLLYAEKLNSRDASVFMASGVASVYVFVLPLAKL